MSIRLRALDRADLGLIRRLFADRCGLRDAAVVAEEVMFGPAPGALVTETFGAFDGAQLIGAAATSGEWLRILAVDPAARGLGVGTSLLAWCESAIASGGHDRCRTVAQPGNYLAPGVAEDDAETLGWLERRGYERGRQNTNLVVDLAGNPRVSQERGRQLAAGCAERGYRVVRAGAGDVAAVADVVGRVFSPTWAFEVERAVAAAPGAVHLAWHQASGALAAFAAHDGNNRGLGWFGPAGTLEAHRGQGLGAALLLACLVDIAAAGQKQAIIAWIGPRAFYDRVVGVSAETHYRVLSKSLALSEEDPP